MGSLASTPCYITNPDGSEEEYQERFLESDTIGEGEFGVVKVVHDVAQKDLIASKPLAAKCMKKGYTFKDNVLYSPLTKEVFQSEVEILRKLNGECYTLKFIAVYETPYEVMIITEYCEGGDMTHFVADTFGGRGGLLTEDISRFSFQLWTAVDHCARNGVIHRDIKPGNIMFTTKQKDSQLRLIDFGSGMLQGLEPTNADVPGNNNNDAQLRHQTYAGSGFYNSPEMFQRSYTSKTDVWSAGVTLYVLAAGYPADSLQDTFNILQDSSSAPRGRIRRLPNLPENLPDSYYDMLEGALLYRHKTRMTAGQLIQAQFPQFHLALSM